MIEILKESKGKTIGIKVSGQLTKEDYEQVLVPRLEEAIHRYGKVRVLFVAAKNFEGFEIKALLDDVKFGLVEGGFHLEKMAVVGGSHWFQAGVRFSGHFIHGEVKFFPSAQLSEAWQWIRRPGRPLRKKDYSYPA